MERSVWYALLIMPGILPGHCLTTPFQTVSYSALQRSWAIRHHGGMNAYSEDLRKKIVEAVERGMPKHAIPWMTLSSDRPIEAHL